MGTFKKMIFGLFLVMTAILQAQDKPTDFLPADFHKERRQMVREMMPANSVAVFFAIPSVIVPTMWTMCTTKTLIFIT